MRQIVAIIFSIVMLACQKEQLPTHKSEIVPIDIEQTGMLSLSGEEPITDEEFRFTILNNLNAYTTTSTGVPVTSIYIADGAGKITRKEGETGLYANQGDNYRFVVTSPTVVLLERDNNGANDFFGVPIERSTPTPLYVGSFTANVDNILTNGYYIYDLGDLILKQYRSKIKVQLKANEESGTRIINEMYFKQVFNKAYYCPVDTIRYGTLLNDNEVYEFAEYEQGKSAGIAYNSDAFVVAPTTTVGSNEHTYLISGDYTDLDLGRTPLLAVGIGVGASTRMVEVPLNIDMEPMYEYTYSVTISSTDLIVSVTATPDWDIVNGNGEIDEITKFSINIDSGEISWDIVDENGSIDEEPTESVVQIVDFTTENNSNCYILNPNSAGSVEFHIPIKRIDEFWTDINYVEDQYLRNENHLERLKNAWEPVMMWHDFDNPYDYRPINKIKIEPVYNASNPVNSYMKVTLPSSFADPLNHCNIGVAVRRTDTKAILWSWHLWITDYNPTALVEQYQSSIVPDAAKAYGENVGGRKNEVHRYNGTLWDGDGTLKDKFIMDRSIGARSPDYEGQGASATKPGTLYYLFGRKDPIPRRAIYVNGYRRSSTTKAQSFEEATYYPTTIRNNSWSWCNEAIANNTDFIWYDYKIYWTGYTGKSIFDPSPLGFKLPLNDTWSDFNGSDEANESIREYTFPWTDYLENPPSEYKEGRLYKGFAYYPSTGFYGILYLEVPQFTKNDSGYHWGGLRTTGGLFYDSSSVRLTYRPSLVNVGYPIRAIQE